MTMTLRVLPITMAGAALLLALKVTGLATSGGYTFAQENTSAPQTVALIDPTAQADFRPIVVAANHANTLEMPPYNHAVDGIITGNAEKTDETKPQTTQDSQTVIPPSPVTQLPTQPSAAPASAAERQLLEQLRQRREELEARNRELDVRENLLKAIEIKVEQRVNELKVLEQQLVLSAPAEDAKKEQAEAEKNRLKDLVTMYESMKPKDAARIFDQLEMRVLVNVVMEMNPRKTSEIIAKMSPASAQKLTVALASQNTTKSAANALDSLPRIEGRRIQ